MLERLDLLVVGSFPYSRRKLLLVHIIKMFGSSSAFNMMSRRLPSLLRLFKVPMRSLTSVHSPEFPYENTSDLVDDEYYEVMEDEAIEELEEAAEESSPVALFGFVYCVVSLSAN